MISLCVTITCCHLPRCVLYDLSWALLNTDQSEEYEMAGVLFKDSESQVHVSYTDVLDLISPLIILLCTNCSIIMRISTLMHFLCLFETWVRSERWKYFSWTTDECRAFNSRLWPAQKSLWLKTLLHFYFLDFIFAISDIFYVDTFQFW